MIPPKKDLKTRRCSMDMNKDIMTLPKKDLKTRPYNMDMDIAILPKKGLKRYDYNVYMDMDQYSCSSCDNKEVTHGLVKSNFVYGYEGLPLCSECAKIIHNASPHYWDSQSIVDLIDIINPSNNFFWKKVLLS